MAFIQNTCSCYFDHEHVHVLQNMSTNAAPPPITGVTTENCCHATARDALFHNYGVIFLSDATGTKDYPDLGYGAMSAAEVHRASLVVLALGTAHVMTVDEMITLTTMAGEPGLTPQRRSS